MPSASMNLQRYRWLAAVYASIIILIVLLADDGDHTFIFAWIRTIPGADKVGHFLLMGGFSFVVNLACGLRTFSLWNRPWLIGSTAVGIIVLLEEISQAWVPSRTFDLMDLMFDFMGIVCFGWLAKKVTSRDTDTKVMVVLDTP